MCNAARAKTFPRTSGLLRDQGASASTLIDSWNVEAESLGALSDLEVDQGAAVTSSCITSDGTFLYIFAHKLLFKLGTGYNGSVRGALLVSRRMETEPNERVWIGMVGGRLLYRSSADSHGVFMELSTDSLEPTGPLVQGEADSLVGAFPYILFTAKDELGVVEATKEGELDEWMCVCVCVCVCEGGA